MSVPRQSLLGMSVLLVATVTALAEPPAAQGPPPSRSIDLVKPISEAVPSDTSRRAREVFEEACSIVAQNFYDEAMHGVDWPAVQRDLADKSAAARGRAALSRVINEALDHLKASHLRHYTPDQREYYELLDVFYPDRVPRAVWDAAPAGQIAYVGVGVVSRTIDGRVYAADVYPGGPADRAGLRIGDELIAVIGSGGPGGPPPADPVRRAWEDISPFRGRAGLETTVIIQRGQAESTRQELIVTPEVLQPHREFLLALRESARLIEQPNPGGSPRRIAYIRVRSYAHPLYQEAIVELLEGRFATCDGLILDLRGGWGGAKPEYLNAFNSSGVHMSYRDRDSDRWRRIGTPWPGPMVAIIDHGTRSGKEIVAHGLKKNGRARLVGERTAGAVLAARPFVLSDESLLIVAVSDVTVDGIRLEAVGVEPDVHVTRNLPYCNGRDEQLDAAITEMGRILARPEPPAQTP